MQDIQIECTGGGEDAFIETVAQIIAESMVNKNKNADGTEKQKAQTA